VNEYNTYIEREEVEDTSKRALEIRLMEQKFTVFDYTRPRKPPTASQLLMGASSSGMDVHNKSSGGLKDSEITPLSGGAGGQPSSEVGAGGGRGCAVELERFNSLHYDPLEGRDDAVVVDGMMDSPKSPNAKPSKVIEEQEEEAAKMGAAPVVAASAKTASSSTPTPGVPVLSPQPTTEELEGGGGTVEELEKQKLVESKNGDPKSPVNNVDEEVEKAATISEKA
jgi:hypothetical protein